MVEPYSQLSVEKLRVSGQATPAKLVYLYMEALLLAIDSFRTSGDEQKPGLQPFEIEA